MTKDSKERSANPEAVPPGTPGAGENVCRRCGGSGRIEGQDCPDCGGSGKVQNACPTCHGEGIVYRTEPLEFRIKPGTRDGQRIRLAGKGNAGTNGGTAGDL